MQFVVGSQVQLGKSGRVVLCPLLAPAMAGLQVFTARWTRLSTGMAGGDEVGNCRQQVGGTYWVSFFLSTVFGCCFSTQRPGVLL